MLVDITKTVALVNIAKMLVLVDIVKTLSFDRYYINYILLQFEYGIEYMLSVSD